MMSRALLALVVCCAALAGPSRESVNPDAQIQQDFAKRIDTYLNLRKTAHEGLQKLKPTKSVETIQSHEHSLARRIRELRHNARQGDIFTPAVAAEFQKLIGVAMQGEDGTHIRQSLRRAEPVHVNALRVNGSYPTGVPLQSTPPTLLLNLPKLPSEVGYRVVGRALVLLDVEANLIVDFIPNAIPVRANAS